MYKKVFLDANILADIYDKNRPFNIQSKKVLLELSKYSDIELFTSCDIITTLYYITAKLNKEEALNAIIETNELCTIVEFANKEIQECCSLMKKNKNYKDLEDAIQYIMAKKMDCDLILSNDKGFMSEDIALFSTKAFVKKFNL